MGHGGRGHGGRESWGQGPWGQGVMGAGAMGVMWARAMWAEGCTIVVQSVDYSVRYRDVVAQGVKEALGLQQGVNLNTRLAQQGQGLGELD